MTCPGQWILLLLSTHGFYNHMLQFPSPKFSSLDLLGCRAKQSSVYSPRSQMRKTEALGALEICPKQSASQGGNEVRPGFGALWSVLSLRS